MALPWNDEAWILRSRHPSTGAPAYVANGRLGLRLGTFILGTDLDAPPLVSAGPEICRKGTAPFDHSYPLQTFAAHVRDRFLYCLPSWANVDLRVGGHRFEPQGIASDPENPITSWLDMRTGEAGLDGTWNVHEEKLSVKIRLLIPRGFSHGAFWELELEGFSKPATVTFGLLGRHLAETLDQSYRVAEGNLVGLARTQRRKRSMGFGLRWHAEGESSTEVEIQGAAGLVTIFSQGPVLKLRVCHSVRGGMETWNEKEIPADLMALENGVRDGTIRDENARHWRAIWESALDVTAFPLSPRDQRLLSAQQFYLLASYDGSRFPTAPLGLSNNMWEGQSLWDTDFWHFGALNALWPTFARQPVKARLATIAGARQNAAAKGLPGAWYGWMSDEEGNEIAPLHYQCEIHLNAWVLLAAWHSSDQGRDSEWLKEVFPMIEAIAHATCARAERDADGSWHLRRVLPPDESVVENPNNPGTCDDSVSTNLAFRDALRAAISAAASLGVEASPLWREVAEGLVVLPAGPDGVIPEYSGYSGHPIKQADVILAFWPLDTHFSDDVILANLEYYRERVKGGPLMTDQIDACIRLRHDLGDRKQVLRELIANYRRFVRGDFEVPYECVDNTNSLMLTACGGLVQALVYGWFKVQDREDLKRIPRQDIA